MTTEVASSTPAPVPAPDNPWSPRQRVLARLLTTGWLVVLTAILLLGHREASYDDLLRDLADGEVSTVAIAAEPRAFPGAFEGMGGGPPGWFTADRTETVRVRWRSTLFSYEAEVRQARSPRAARQARQRGADVPVVPGTVRQLMAEQHPEVRVVPLAPRSRTHLEMSGWRLEGPGWAVLTGLGVLVATLVLVARSPEPWRATRWAWAWIALLLPLGGLAYLVLGGPAGTFRPGPSPSDRLTGGWAFLICLGIGVLLGLVTGNA